MLENIRPIHPFPARMAPELAWDQLAPGAKPLCVLDPMAGSGTTLVAARLRGHRAIGFDRDPLAVLIAQTWVSDIDSDAVRKKAVEVFLRAQVRHRTLTTKTAFPYQADDETKEFLRFWFDTDSRKELTALATSIRNVRREEVRNVLWCAFSRLIITKNAGASLAMDVSHSRPHRAFTKAPRRPFDCFIQSVERVVRLAPFNTNNEQPTASVRNADARRMPLVDATVDLIITSPPYLNAIDYLRGHKMSLVWMGHTVSSLRAVRATNVGTEVSAKDFSLDSTDEQVMATMCSGAPLDSRQSGMLRQYVRDIRELLTECRRVLKPKGKGVFVIGDCTIKTTLVSNSAAIEAIGADLGLQLVATRRRPLPENRRYLPPPEAKSAGVALQKRMRDEVILTLQKVS